LRHVGFPVSPRDYRGLTASAFSLPWRSADDKKSPASSPSHQPHLICNKERLRSGNAAQLHPDR
ncbi:MAG: hypothetical protein ABW095_11005, partial [Candidatus Thiodiazotropha sp.]